MTQEDKELLLKDLCARLPYGVKVQDELGRVNKLVIGNADLIRLYYNDFSIYEENALSLPYLRPMSSMTEEECDMVEEILGDNCIFDFMSNGDIILKQGQFSQKKLSKLYDYYNSIHIDYRGLIPMGLALEAPEGMYNKTKEE